MGGNGSKNIKGIIMIIILVLIWFCFPVGIGVWVLNREGIKVSIWQYILSTSWLVVCIKLAVELERKEREKE